MKEKANHLERYMLAILSRKFDVIADEMNHTLQRASRSTALNLAKDFSSAILTDVGDLFRLTQAIPIIVASCSLAARQMTELFDDLQPGDCFLNNPPYYGCSHHGDFAYMTPIFFKGEHILTTLTVAHQADIGNSQPTTFMLQKSRLVYIIRCLELLKRVERLLLFALTSNFLNSKEIQYVLSRP